MYCKHCGKEIADNAVVCIHCGCSVVDIPAQNPEHLESKKGTGILLGLFLGLIGLIIGVLMYPSGTVARTTFIKGWFIGLIIDITCIVFFYVFIIALVMTGGCGAYY